MLSFKYKILAITKLLDVCAAYKTVLIAYLISYNRLNRQDYSVLLNCFLVLANMFIISQN